MAIRVDERPSTHKRACAMCNEVVSIYELFLGIARIDKPRHKEEDFKVCGPCITSGRSDAFCKAQEKDLAAQCLVPRVPADKTKPDAAE